MRYERALKIIRHNGGDVDVDISSGDKPEVVINYDGSWSLIVVDIDDNGRETGYAEYDHTGRQVGGQEFVY